LFVPQGPTIWTPFQHVSSVVELTQESVI